MTSTWNNVTDHEPTNWETAADWLDAVLDDSWKMRTDTTPYSDEVWFDLGAGIELQARIAVRDGQIDIHEFENGMNVATTTLSGDIKRQTPRVLTILGID